MSYQEFVYEHDLNLIQDLIERYMSYHGFNSDNNVKDEPKVED